MKPKPRELFLAASTGNSQPAAAMYYNDQKPDKIFYQGLALRKLGREEEARGRFNRLIDFGEKHLFDTFKMDYFAVSLPDLQIWEDDMDKKNRIHCNYLMGLGHLGLGNLDKANVISASPPEWTITTREYRYICKWSETFYSVTGVIYELLKLIGL